MLKELMKEAGTPLSVISYKQSAISGLEEWDIPQTLIRMTEYLERHEANPKPANLLLFTTHLVKLWEETKYFELEFHSKKMLGDLNVELRKVDEAKSIFKKWAKLSDNNLKYKEQMLMYEQIGYWDQVNRRFEESIVWFKKQLELAWFENDHEAETMAYGSMSKSHFYLGDLDKANYYHDRMVRGKLENEKSSLKSMSHFVIKNRRDAKNDQNFRKKNFNVRRPESQTLPSPREHNKTNSLIVPTVNLLPHYFVGEDIVFQKALKEYTIKMKYNLFNRSKKLLHVIDTHKYLEKLQDEKKELKLHGKSSPSPIDKNLQYGEFTRPELLFMNKKPTMEYLRKEKIPSKYQPPKINFFKGKHNSPEIPRRHEQFAKKDFSIGYFKKIVQTAKNRNDMSTKKRMFIFKSHMSELKMEPICQYNPEDVVETVKRSIGVIRYKFNEYLGKVQS